MEHNSFVKTRASQRLSAPSVTPAEWIGADFDHDECGRAFGVAGGKCQTGIDDEAWRPSIKPRPRKASPAFMPVPLRVWPDSSVDHRRVNLTGARLAIEIDIDVVSCA